MVVLNRYFVLKFVVILFCSSFGTSTYQTAISNRPLRPENAQVYFGPYFQPQWFAFPGRSRTKEDISRLTTSLLHDIHVRAGKNFNILLSPISIYMILAMLLEGASGRTEGQLKQKLNLQYGPHEQGQQIIRNRIKELLNIKAKKNPTEFENLNFIVSDKSEVINPQYKKIIREFYSGRHFEVGNGGSVEISNMINTWASQATRNKIPAIVSPEILSNLVLIIGNAVHFKSKWKYPFDPSLTTWLPFKDEYDRAITKVPMMSQVAVLPYTYSQQLESEIVEIPYGDDSTSMIVILPSEKVTLNKVLLKMRYFSLDQIIPKNSTEEAIQLLMPRFHIESNMYLNEILKQDLRSVFSPQEAEFPYIGKNVFVSKVYHKAEIENTEEGTTASALSSVQFAYKSSTVIFRADRPFIYLITDMKTKTVLFAGTYSNPFLS